ncbi:diacylglycerol kinase family protein [Ornithobacterium rhinotracheale]|uniref:Diacylglycerol kinase family protein n=1 Tax=Ornithobacterium rhinotracheale TaxID=28251 RepID=A0A3R5UY90_ORNRH|nr:diacylglycerol kinase family protein [Ornithobacterium rhinotracheale]QAR31248.1 diacylglycerol kinase family protein [Ornithobacterium rhinotracheale]
MKKFVGGRIKSVKYVFIGMWKLISTEDAIISQIILFTPLIFLGFYFGISRIEWAIQFFCLALILTAESLNTAIEKLCDFVHPDFHHKIGFIKDVSAGASGFAVLISLVIGVLIYYPYICAL